MILFIIVAIVGIISYVDDDGEHDFTYGVSFGIGVIISFCCFNPYRNIWLERNYSSHYR